MAPYDVRLQVPALPAFQPVLADAANQYGLRQGIAEERIKAFVELVTLAAGAVQATSAGSIELQIDSADHVLQARIAGDGPVTVLSGLDATARFEARAGELAKDFLVDNSSATLRFSLGD